jgi:hypothetical protein
MQRTWYKHAICSVQRPACNAQVQHATSTVRIGVRCARPNSERQCRHDDVPARTSIQSSNRTVAVRLTLRTRASTARSIRAPIPYHTSLTLRCLSCTGLSKFLEKCQAGEVCFAHSCTLGVLTRPPCGLPMCTHPVAGPEWRLCALPTTAACASKRACRGSHAGRAMLHGRMQLQQAMDKCDLQCSCNAQGKAKVGRSKSTRWLCATRPGTTSSLVTRSRNVQHTTCSMQRAIINLQHATCNKPMRQRMQSSIRNAACDVANANDLQPSAALALRSWLCTGTSPTPSGWPQR